MPKAARGDGTDTVNTNHGCDATTVTNECSGDVFWNEIGAVRLGDQVMPHLVPVGDDCGVHAPVLDGNYSGNVFVNGKNAAFLGSTYSGHNITSGSGNVYIN